MSARRALWKANLPYLLWAVLFAALGLGAHMVPLLGVVSYELGLVTAALLAVAGMHLGSLSTIRAMESWTPPKTLKQALRASARLAWTATWRLLVLVAIPADLVFALGADGPNCHTAAGLAFYALTAGGAALVAGLLAAASALFFRRTLRTVLLAELFLLAVWARDLYVFYSNPPVCVYDLFVGYFPGNLYDRLLVLHKGIWASRFQDLVFALGVFGTAIFWSPKSPIRSLLSRSSTRVGKTFGPTLLGLALLVGSVRTQLGFPVRARAIAQVLGGTVSSAHFVVFYDAGSIDESEALQFAEDAEFRYWQLEEFFGRAPKGKIHVFLFASRLEKKKLLGAHRVEMAKPWRHEVYVTEPEFPHPVLKHELAHVFASTFGDRLFGVAFRWVLWRGLVPIPNFNPGLIEGVAVAADWRPSELDPHQRAKALSELGWPLPLESVMGYSFFGSAAVRSYSVAGSFCRFLIDRYGMKKFQALYRSGGDFKGIYGLGLTDLSRQWRAFLKTVPLSAGQLDLARRRLKGIGVFQTTCLHKVAALLHEAEQAPWSQAVQYYRRVLELDCRSTEALWGLFFAHLHLDRFRKARIWARAIWDAPLTTKEDRAFLLVHLADAYWTQGDLARARICLHAALRLAEQPDTKRAAQVRLGALARPFIRRAVHELLVDQTERAVSDLNLALHRDPTWGPGYYLVGSYLLFLGRYGQAAYFLRRSLLVGLPTPELRDEALYRLGKARYLAGDFEQAQGTFELLVDRASSAAAKRRAQDWIERCRWALGPGSAILSHLRVPGRSTRKSADTTR